jgi:MFS transporter, PPP family, 3-phenylpropionic acid transporter
VLEIKQNINLRFFILQASIAAMSCIGAGFITPILINFGYGALEIGVAMTLAALASSITKPIWGYIHDKYSYSKQIVLIVNAVGCLSYILLVLSNGTHGFVELAVMGVISSIMGMMNFIDSWAIRLLSEGYILNYGATRSGGSLTYAITGIVFGYIMNSFGIIPGISIMIGIFMIQVATVLTIPNAKNQPEINKRPKLSTGLKYLLHNKPYILLLITFFLSSIPMSATDSFFPLLITKLGGTEKHIGIGIFLQAMSEIPVLVYYNHIKVKSGKSPTFFLTIGLGVYGIKCIGMGMAPTYQIALAMTLLNGLSFGLVLSASIDFILKYVHREYLATSYLLSSALGSGFGAIIGNLVNGIIAENIGVSKMMLLASSFSFITMVTISFAGIVRTNITKGA